VVAEEHDSLQLRLHCVLQAGLAHVAVLLAAAAGPTAPATSRTSRTTTSASTSTSTCTSTSTRANDDKHRRGRTWEVQWAPRDEVS
jgi:pyruvate/oxaloacetate carboxyltransferase